MGNFIQRYLWMVITLIGLLVLCFQISKRRGLQSRLDEAEVDQPARSTRSQPSRVRFSIGSSAVLLERFGEAMESDDTSPLLSLARLLSSATSADMIQLLNDLPDDSENEELRGHLIYLLGALDPMAALEWAPDPEQRWLPFAMLAQRSPDEASAWLSTAEAGEQADYFARMVREARLLANPSAYTDPWDALDMDLPMLSPSTFDSVARAINLPKQKKNREIMIKSLLLSASIEDPALAQSYADKLELTEEEVMSALSEMAAHEMGSPELLEWSFALQEASEDVRHGLQDEYLSVFAQRDLAGAGRWLAALDAPSGTKDNLIRRYSYLFQNVDPVEAMTWVNRIEDPKKRANARGRMLAEWKFKDSKSAAEWEARQR